jgi:regulator of cell morphogenesis and NO signaling
MPLPSLRKKFKKRIKMNISKETIIGAIVAEDYRTAGVFEQAGIDFCCNGGRTVEVACRESQVAAESLVMQLQQVMDASPREEDPGRDYNSWPLDLLADFIEKKHHRYVSVQTPLIQAFLDKIVRVHGGRHRELAEIKMHFDACAGELAVHMKKEELLLFPYIRKMVQAGERGGEPVSAPFGTVGQPIQAMMQEHDAEGARFRRIRKLSGGYAVPEDACNTYRAAFAALQEFEGDLHLHIHLENNILFPRALELEQRLSGKKDERR